MDQDRRSLKYKDISCTDTYIGISTSEEGCANPGKSLAVMMAKLAIEIDMLARRQDDLEKDIAKVLELIK